MTRALILARMVTLATVGDAYAQSTLQRCLGVVPDELMAQSGLGGYDNCYEPGPAPRRRYWPERAASPTRSGRGASSPTRTTPRNRCATTRSTSTAWGTTKPTPSSGAKTARSNEG